MGNRLQKLLSRSMRALGCVLAVAGPALAAGIVSAQTLPWMNTSLAPEQRASLGLAVSLIRRRQRLR